MNTYFIIVFLYLHCKVKADFKSQASSYPLLIDRNDHLSTDPLKPTTCSLVLDAFADSVSNFTKCSIKHARPIKFCAECIEQYLSFRDKYEKLLTSKDDDGISCKLLFISHDRLDAVLEYHDNILSIWEKGHCNACFNWTAGPDKPKLSNDTIKFTSQFNKTINCIIDNRKLMPNNTNEVCQKCMLTYIQLDELYKSMSKDSIGVDSICMDIVDSMNATRYLWSKDLNCCNLRRSPEIIFLCCTAIIAMLPLLFYVAVRFCGPIRDLPNVLKQSRFKQMLLKSSNGRIN